LRFAADAAEEDEIDGAFHREALRTLQTLSEPRNARAA
jgi:hypothetical protein